MRSVSAQNYTIPAGLKVGTFLVFQQDSTGTTTIVPGSGQYLDNPSSTLTLTQGQYVTAHQIAANKWRLSKSDASGHIIEDEGTPVTQRGTMNFVGAGVAVTDVGSKTTVTITGGSSITPSALTKTDDTNVTLTLGGTPATALLEATSITAGWTGSLSAARGGTGQTSYTTGDIPYASGTSTISKLGIGTSGYILTSSGSAPTWTAFPYEYSRVASAISTGTLTLDINSQKFRNFDLT